MINADEHKKLLAQIAELEKNSVNYFDVEKEFFLIDSDNLLQVRPKLYGYSIQRTGIYEDDNLTPEAIAGLDGRGCYVYVGVKDGEITIKQDLNGCWGIYLFQHGDYFALSNSFFRLLDHVKFKYPLTVNRDYINHNLLAGIFLNFACSETAVNEIRLVDRSAILYIDATRKQLDVELIDYKEHTRSLDSAEGVATLDHWVEFWANAFSSIAQRTKFIQADLSGGFDSRVSLVPVLHSGIALNKIRVYSIKDDLHTHREDYEIAYKIASHYGFKLNQALPERKNFSLGLSDVWNLDFYVRQTATKDPALFWTIKNIQRLYSINGNAGETIRHRWHGSPKEFMEELLRKFYPYSKSLSDKMLHSMRNIFESSFSTICNKYKIKDKNSEEILQFLYQETWSRHHFGKGATCDYFKNRICLSPVLDPEVRTLRLNTPECPDANLLIALLFTRYEPDLLIFPFEGNNSIASETIAYAKKINERFPRRPKDIATVIGGGYFNLQPRDKKAEKILLSGHKNPNIPKNFLQDYLKKTFESSRTYGLFTAYFDEELYHYAMLHYDKYVFGRERPMYAILGVTKVLEDVEISQRNRPLYDGMRHFLEQDFAKIHEDDSQIIRKFKDHFTARIDARFMTAAGDFQILSCSDEKATILKPDWYQKNGAGYIIQSYVGNLEIVTKATVDGQISMRLRGIYVPDPKDNSKHIPYWIDYTKLTINDKIIFDTLTPAWHDKSCSYTLDVKANEEIKIQVEWLPHRSDT